MYIPLLHGPLRCVTRSSDSLTIPASMKTRCHGSRESITSMTYVPRQSEIVAAGRRNNLATSGVDGFRKTALRTITERNWRYRARSHVTIEIQWPRHDRVGNQCESTRNSPNETKCCGAALRALVLAASGRLLALVIRPSRKLST